MLNSGIKEILALQVILTWTIFSCYQIYEPVEEGSYIKMIDMVSGHGGQIQVS